MGLIEAILLGFHSERLEKPLVFFTMLVGFVAFCALGVAMITMSIVEALDAPVFTLAPIFVGVGISFLFWAIAALCGYFVKRCFD